MFFTSKENDVAVGKMKHLISQLPESVDVVPVKESGVQWSSIF
jgi:hypothetical protein